MNKLIVILLLLGISTTSFSQKEEEDRPRKVKRPGLPHTFTGLNLRAKGDPHRMDRVNVGLFWNNWIGDKNGVKTKWHSFGFSANFMFDIQFTKDNKFGMGIGPGFSHYDLHHDGQFSFQNIDTDPFTLLAPINDSVTHKRNKTSWNYIEIPFELRIRTMGKKVNFKFYPGFKVGWQTNLYSKFVDNTGKYKELNFRDRRQIHYAATLRIGIDRYFLSASYHFSSMFKNPNSVKLSHFSVGISFGLF